MVQSKHISVGSAEYVQRTNDELSICGTTAKNMLELVARIRT